ncbi:FkbM family methyltransferase [Phormidium sp. CCY1219]|uniref:FkbM family methyltransferase n=1 Tax=Phormidium sp. CCY1219 TaxID=2886104 RepID=UPI002D1F3431|nr:FkbM family methyltransferase [Phormidium sp. CCY1219]MEB3831391.1 FkbM family methyltransferase [Phormidium sp. CCY1219]
MALFVPFLKKGGHLDQIQMTLFNVGSRKVEREDDLASQGWDLFAPQLTIYGFDADADACEAANADLEARQINWSEQHIPLAFANASGERTLYVTRNPQCSSLYPPNQVYLRRFNNTVTDLMELDFTVEIETTTLDEFCDQERIEEIDFLQTDVQGADLLVLEGSSRLLERSILAVKVEVEFAPLYVGQPLFAEVDTFLRKWGFSLFKLTAACRPRASSPIVSSEQPGQFLWGDAFYIRDPIDPNLQIEFKTPERILKVACIADIMGFPDYALELLEYLTLNYGNESQYNCANAIVEGLAKFPQLIPKGLNALPIVEKIRDRAFGSALELLQEEKNA